MMTETSGTPTAESPFWRFSLRFYARPKVAAACLVLQDEAGADVNLLLFLLFLAEQRRQLTGDDVLGLDRAIAAWRDGVVKPLRDVRRALKTGIGEIPVAVSESFRGRLKRIELESERIEQEWLERVAGSLGLGTQGPSRVAAAQQNLAAYAARLGGRAAEPLAMILSAFAMEPEDSS